MKNLLLPIALSFFLLIAFSTAGAEETPDLDVSSWTLNPAPVLGPEGIVLGSDGSIYMGGHDGRIWRINQESNMVKMEQFADLNSLPGQREDRISAIGIATDANGDLYAATLDFNSGSVLKVRGPGKPDAGQVSLFRSGIGMANFILIDKESSTMYVSDSSMLSGRVFRFDMNDQSRTGAAVDEASEKIGKFRYANGLALSPDKHWLYVAETTSGCISKINLETKEADVFAELGGWPDGLYFEPSRQLLFACDNKGGRIAAIDSSGKVVGEVRLLGREGQCAPASLIFTDPNTIVFTDLWRASLFRALIGKPEYHSYAYRLNVDEIVK